MLPLALVCSRRAEDLSQTVCHVFCLLTLLWGRAAAFVLPLAHVTWKPLQYDFSGSIYFLRSIACPGLACSLQRRNHVGNPLGSQDDMVPSVVFVSVSWSQIVGRECVLSCGGSWGSLSRDGGCYLLILCYHI